MPLTRDGARAREWRRATLAAVCDELRPWEFGLVARAHRYPGYWDLNTVIIERPTALSAAALEEVADEALEDVAHRRIDIEDPGEAVRLRPKFERLGWQVLPLVWMRYEGQPEAMRRLSATVEEVPYDAVSALRQEWHEEDFPGVAADTFPGEAREVALARGARVLAVREGGEPVAYAQVDGSGPAVEVGEVFVTARRRRRGLGTAVTAAAIAAAAAAGAQDIWICAEDGGRAEPLYARLGFRGVWWTTDMLRLPASG